MSDRIGLRLVSCKRCGVAYNARTNHRCAFRHLPDCRCDFALIDEYCIARERLDAVEAARPDIEAKTIEKVVAILKAEEQRFIAMGRPAKAEAIKCARERVVTNDGAKEPCTKAETERDQMQPVVEAAVLLATEGVSKPELQRLGYLSRLIVVVTDYLSKKEGT